MSRARPSEDEMPLEKELRSGASITSIRSDWLEPVHPALQDLDPYTQFLYQPHTVTALILGIGGLVYFSGVLSLTPVDLHGQPAEEIAYKNAKLGVWSAIFVFLGYSILQGPRSSLVRPHPVVWRIAHALLLLYLLFIVFLLFQEPTDARHFLKHLYPELGVELDERAYGTDCRLWIPGKGLNVEVIRATLFDEFVIAHTLGWWGKALILREYVMLWVLSIGFELMELTFQHMLPNFNECWWDSWILDVAVCNFLGMSTGMLTVRFFEAKEYNWRGISSETSLTGKIKRGLMQFTPYSWDKFQWQVTSSPGRLLLCMAPAVVFLLFEVNAFFLKYVLWVPPRNMLNTYRLLILFLGAIPAVKEYYDFIESGSNEGFRRLGAFAWLVAATALVETLVCIKFGRGMFPQPWPRITVVAWGTAGALFVVAMIIWSVKFYIVDARKKKLA